MTGIMPDKKCCDGQCQCNADTDKKPSVDFVRILGRAVKKFCSCGGRGPSDNLACPACAVWHEVTESVKNLI